MSDSPEAQAKTDDAPFKDPMDDGAQEPLIGSEEYEAENASVSRVSEPVPVAVANKTPAKPRLEESVPAAGPFAPGATKGAVSNPEESGEETVVESRRQAAPPAQRSGRAQTVMTSPEEGGEVMQAVDFQPLNSNRAAGMEAPARKDDRLSHLMKVDVEAQVCLGSAQLRLNQVMDLHEGSVVTLDREVGENVDLLVNSQIYAQGQIVVVGDRYGLRILKLVEG
jgi:flagellar motor switch protein FliN/FliY